MSSTQGKGATPSGNQPTTSTRGGASAYPTPANNSGGGSGWGDSGFLKGGLEGVSNRLPSSSSSSSSSSNESATSKIPAISGDFASISEQKGAGEASHRRDVAEAESAIPSTAEASFMNHKPGGSGTLPGWEKAKGAINSVTGMGE